MAIIDYNVLRQGIRRFKLNGGTYADLRRRTGGALAESTIGRIASGDNREPRLEIWLTLHQAAPEFIPPPPVLGQAGQAGAQLGAAVVNLGPERQVPVFDAGAGHNRFWDDGGYPLGQSDEYLSVPTRESDLNTFAVRVHGNSMAPKIEDGDRVIVVPSRRLEHGNVCFVTNSEEPDGEKLIRRYFVYGNTIVLKPDNPDEGFEIQISDGRHHGYRMFKVTEVRKRF